MKTEPAPTGRNFRSDIQGLRTLAVLAVVLYHASSVLVPGGFVGVDVFFVISGFLITGHLVRELETSRFGFGKFYARRVRRLVPVAVVVLICTFIASEALLSPLRAESLARDAAATALYVPNIWFSYTGVDYLSDHLASPFQQFWSLGVEEQFYLVWPVLLFLCWRLSRGSAKAPSIALSVVFVFSFALSVFTTPNYETWAFFNLPTRAWEFAAGGGVALFISSRRGRQALTSLPALFRAIASWIAFAALVFCLYIYNSAIPYPGVAALLPVAATALFILFSRSDDLWGPSRILRVRWVQWIAERSYSIYLWHWPLIIIPVTAYPNMPKLLLVGSLLATLVLSHFSYEYIEEPVRNSSRLRLIPNGRFLLGSVAVIATVAIVVVGAGSLLEKRLIASDQIAPPIESFDQVSFTEYVPSNGQPTLQKANTDVPKASEDGCSPGRYSSEAILCEYGNVHSDITYALFGDSHAAQWFPVMKELARRDDARLVVFIKSGCNSIATPVYKDGDVDNFCVEWRDNVLEVLRSEGVNTLFISNFHEQPGKDGKANDSHIWAEATSETLAKLSDMNVRVIADSPTFDRSPVTCALENVDDLTPCEVPRDEVVDSEWQAEERTAVEAAGATYVNPTDQYCTNVCGPYIGDTLVYRDNHHLTATFMSRRAGVLAEVLMPSQAS